MVEYTAIALLFMFITAVFMVITYFSQAIWLKLFMGAMFSLMVVADFNLAQVIAQDIDPTNTGLINVLTTFYIISIVFFLLAFVIFAFTMFIKLLLYLKELPQIKRQDRSIRFRR